MSEPFLERYVYALRCPRHDELLSKPRRKRRIASRLRESGVPNAEGLSLSRREQRLMLKALVKPDDMRTGWKDIAGQTEIWDHRERGRHTCAGVPNQYLIR